MIELSNITFVHIDGRQSLFPRFYHYAQYGHLYWPIKYAEYANKYFKFGKYLIITPDYKKYEHEFIQFKNTACFGYKGYSQFVVKSLIEYIETDFCLVYQSDGSIYNPHLWSSDFLEYDYIGAPWSHSAPISYHCKNPCRVGNGGFSLRSKKFLYLSSKVNSCPGPEDICLLCGNSDFLKKNGIKIATCEVARLFSVEYAMDDQHTPENCFGFHKPRWSTNAFINSYREKILQELQNNDKTY